MRDDLGEEDVARFLHQGVPRDIDKALVFSHKKKKYSLDILSFSVLFV